MLKNVLDEWKRNCFFISSNYTINPPIINRSESDRVYNVLLNYFTYEYFTAKSVLDPDGKSSWLHYLLVNSDKVATIAAIYEIANLIEYLKTLSPGIQKQFQTLFNDPRHFRDILFEIYIYRLLDFNKIPNKKKPKEGKKELDVICTLYNEEYLCECRKIYAPGIALVESIFFLFNYLYVKLPLYDLSNGLIGMIKINRPNDSTAKRMFMNKINNFFENIALHIEENIYSDVDDFGELSIQKFDSIKAIELELNGSAYHLVFIVKPKEQNESYSKVSFKGNYGIPEEKIISKLHSAIEEKRLQHSQSKYTRKIYFFDNENTPDSNFPLFSVDSMWKEDEIIAYVENCFENEIFCFINRDFRGVIPKIEIKVYGKNLDKNVKYILSNLKTNFAYRFIS